MVFVLYITGFRFSQSTLHFLPLPLLLLLIIFLIFFTAIVRGSRQSYIRNKMYLTRTHFEFSGTCVLITSKYGSSSFQWNQIDSIKEFKPAFIISMSGTDEYVISRKCFTDQTKLNNFTSLCTSHIDADKLILKHYGVLPASQIHNADPVSAGEPAQSVTEAGLHCDIKSDGEPNTVEIRFSLNRKEAVFFELERYYRQFFSKILTLTGILMITIFVYDRIRSVNFLYSDIIIPAAGCFLILVIPFSAWIRVNQSFKSSGNKPQTQIFRFDENYLYADIGTDMKKYRWNELLTFAEQKGSYVFSAKSSADYQKRSRIISKVTRKDYCIPKSAFRTPEDLMHFEEILKKTQKFIVK